MGEASSVRGERGEGLLFFSSSSVGREKETGSFPLFPLPLRVAADLQPRCTDSFRKGLRERGVVRGSGLFVVGTTPTESLHGSESHVPQLCGTAALRSGSWGDLRGIPRRVMENRHAA